jgi:hypothetical protein
MPKLSDFREDEDGSISIELLLCVPILLWCLLATVVYFDAYRTKAATYRAALTIADMFSREQAPIDQQFMDGAHGLLHSMSKANTDPELRASVYTFDDPDHDGNGDYRLIWSRNRDMGANLAPNDLQNLELANRLPIMAHDDKAFLIETRTAYEPPFSIGIGFFNTSNLDVVQFDTFKVTRPRFASATCFDPTINIAGDDIC